MSESNAAPRHLHERDLVALNQAALSVSGGLSLDKTLQQISDSARVLANAQYAALGVFNAEGRLVEFISAGMSEEVVSKIDHSPIGLGLLKAILDEGRAIRVPKIADDPRSVGFPANHPVMDSLLGVPIVGAEEVLGNLYLSNKLDKDEFSDTDEKLIEMLAAHAAIAIQNAKLHEQAAQAAIIEERARIGMDLHDSVIQSIYAVGLTLESARMLLPDDPQEVNNIMGSAIDELNGAIRDIRNLILDLRPHRFDVDLSRGIARLVREFQANSGVPVTLKAPSEVLNSLKLPITRAIFMTTQEALANVVRHAHASQVTIEASRDSHTIVLSIVDDGQGFDAVRDSKRVGHGLSNMRARAEELKGTFEINAAREQGTSIRIELPIE